jgi:hypothetical protein
MRLKSLSDLANALEIHAKKAPKTPKGEVCPSISTNFLPPEVSRATVQEQSTHMVERPARTRRRLPSVEEIKAHQREQFILAGIAFYQDTIEEKVREPDPQREYTGPRFVPPKRRVYI